MTEIDYAARVAKGAALLDEKKPGWERKIDLDELDIESSHSCVTAQLSGVRWYADGMNQLGLTPGSDGTYVAHGFNAESCDPDCPGDAACRQPGKYATLNRLWRELIESRLAASPEAPAGG